MDSLREQIVGILRDAYNWGVIASQNSSEYKEETDELADQILALLPTTTAKQKPIEKLKGFIKIPLSHIESVSIERPRGKNFYSVYHGGLEYRSTVMCMKINEIIDQLNNLQKKHG